MDAALAEEKLSVSEVARVLGVTPRTVTNYIRYGYLDAHRYSHRKQVVTETALKSFLSRTWKRSKLEQLDLFDENFFTQDKKVA